MVRKRFAKVATKEHEEAEKFKKKAFLCVLRVSLEECMAFVIGLRISDFFWASDFGFRIWFWSQVVIPGSYRLSPRK